MRNIEELKSDMTKMNAELNSIRKGCPIADIMSEEEEKTERFFAEKIDGDIEMLRSVVTDMTENHERKLKRVRKFAK